MIAFAFISAYHTHMSYIENVPTSSSHKQHMLTYVQLQLQAEHESGLIGRSLCTKVLGDDP